MSTARLTAAIAAAFLAGLVIMVGFEGPLARVAGMALLLAFTAGGVWLVAVDLAGRDAEGDE
jgi:hypothetical protein